MSSQVVGLSKVTLEERRPSAGAASGGSRAATAPPARTAGSTRSRTTGASGGPSTTTDDGHVRLDAVRARRAVPAVIICPAGPPSDDANWSRAPTLQATPRNGWRSRSSSPRSGGPRQGRESARGLRLSLSGGRLTTIGSSSTGRSSRATSSPISVSRRCASTGSVELVRLELGGLQPVEEGAGRPGALRVVQEAFTPAPRPCRRSPRATQAPDEA